MSSIVDHLPRRRRRTQKCTKCRADKKKCELNTEDADGKCKRCDQLGHQCSERLTAEEDTSHWYRYKRRRKSASTGANHVVSEEQLPRPGPETANPSRLERHESLSSNTTVSTNTVSESPRSSDSILQDGTMDSFMSMTPPEPTFQSNVVTPRVSLEAENPHLHQQISPGSFSSEVDDALDHILGEMDDLQEWNPLGSTIQTTPRIRHAEPLLSQGTPIITSESIFDPVAALNANLVEDREERDAMLWQNHQRRETAYKKTSSALAPLLATLRESKARTREHKHKPASLKPQDCPPCSLLLGVARTRQIPHHVCELLATAKEALEDEDDSQAELFFLKAQSAMMEFTDGSYDDEDTTAITLELIKLYQGRNSALEAERFIEILAKRTRDTKSLTQDNAQAMLLESLRKTTSEVCKPLENYDLSGPNSNEEDSVVAVPFTLPWRALCRNIRLQLDDVNLNIRDSYGNTALHDYIQRGDTRAVELLVTAGACLLARNRDQQTPLEIACIYGSLEIVQYLVEFTYGTGQSIMTIIEPQVYGAGSTPLHAAIEHRWPDIVRYLLDKRARTDKTWTLPTNQGLMAQKMMTPMDLASYMAQQPNQSANEKEKSERILRMLLTHTQTGFLNRMAQVGFLDEETIVEEAEAPIFGEQLAYGYEPVTIHNVQPIASHNIVGD